jgi:hypothetical protein
MSNTCERCGGAKLAWYKGETVTGGPWTEVVGDIRTFTSDHTTPAPISAGYTPSIPKLCNCPPEQSKHDGQLSEYCSISMRNDKKFVLIEEDYQCMAFNPQEALSLLAWLQQERETLEQWAKEQEEA